MFNNYVGSALTEKHKKNYGMHYTRQLKKFHELQEMKAKNVAYRNEILKKQKINNYRNELDRITDVLSNSVFKNHTSHDTLKKRKQELDEMFKNNISPDMIKQKKEELVGMMKNVN